MRTGGAARVFRWVGALLVLGAMFLPVARNSDGLPLSTYPMYAHTRPSEAVLVRVVGFAADGSETDLSIRDIADTRDPLVAQSYLNQAARSGDVGQLCLEVSDRLSGPVARVQVVEERHDVVARVRGDASMLDRAVLASCEVP